MRRRLATAGHRGDARCHWWAATFARARACADTSLSPLLLFCLCAAVIEEKDEKPQSAEKIPDYLLNTMKDEPPYGTPPDPVCMQLIGHISARPPTARRPCLIRSFSSTRVSAAPQAQRKGIWLCPDHAQAARPQSPCSQRNVRCVRGCDAPAVSWCSCRSCDPPSCRASWGSRFDGLEFMTSAHHPGLPTVVFPIRDESRNTLWPKIKWVEEGKEGEEGAGLVPLPRSHNDSCGPPPPATECAGCACTSSTWTSTTGS